MEIVTGDQMRRIDRRAIEQLAIPGLQLMEAAGRGVAEAFLADYPEARDETVVILCGKGNNGGDGLVVARHLARAGLAPRVFLLARADQLGEDPAANFRAAKEAGVAPREITDESDWGDLRTLLDSRPLVIDALLGTGVRGGARGLVGAVIAALNRSGSRVAAIDLPSGVDADSSRVEGAAVRAERTYTLCRPKLPLVFAPASDHAGRWSVVPIGIPDEAVQAESVELEWLDHRCAAALLPRRGAEDHKGRFGHLLAVAGSPGKSGAAVLLARGALRCGVGLMTVAAPASVQERIAVQQAEVMTEPLAESGGGGLAPSSVDVILDLAAGRDALAIGPGLGTDEGTREVVRAIVERGGRPTVVDADGLNALAPIDRERGVRPPAVASAPLVLTPHPGEAARLLGRGIPEVQSDRLGAARELARATGAVVVLKGHRSLVARHDGRVAVNASGNPGMATAGTGDVLTGAVGAFLARGLDGWDAARLAVFAHGDAGDRAALDQGQEAMIASDLVDRLPATLSALAGRTGF